MVQTECIGEQIEFQGLGRRKVTASLDGGRISSDGGALALRELDERAGILERFAQCFSDHRNPDLIEHTVEELIRQRVYGIATGYEDLNDHDQLRDDALLATMAGKTDPTGLDRRRTRDRGHPLAAASTLNRLELTPADADRTSRYKKIVYDGEAIEKRFVEFFLDATGEAPEQIILDFDATDDPLHGTQEGRFFHGYYRSYCYLPLYVFCGHFLLSARLRPSNIDAAAGTIEELERIVCQVRERWPETKIVLRADSGFTREEIMAWCEANGVDYVLGLAKNARLVGRIAKQMDKARRKYIMTGRAQRQFANFSYRTHKSWSRRRRVVGKAEYLAKGPNPRFVVTSLPTAEIGARELYEKLYCARGDMENRIKEQQLGMFADRTSAHTMRANQLRLWLSSMAYVLVDEFRRVALKATELAKAQVDTIRLKLFKIGALVTVSVRRVHVRLSSSHPWARLLPQVIANIRRAYPLRV